MLNVSKVIFESKKSNSMRNLEEYNLNVCIIASHFYLDTVLQQQELSNSPESNEKINCLSLNAKERQHDSESAVINKDIVTIRNVVKIQNENNRVSNLRASRSFSNLQRPIIPKTFRHIAVGNCENTRSFGDLASIVSNHSTEKDKLFLNVKREEFKRKSSAGVVNGNYS